MAKRTKRDTELRKVLAELMQAQKISIRDLAKIAEVPHSTLSSWLQGSNPDNFPALKKIADHFSVSLTYLLLRQEDKISAKKIPPITAVFEQGHTLFSGYAKIHIETLLPKGKKEGTNE